MSVRRAVRLALAAALLAAAATLSATAPAVGTPSSSERASGWQWPVTPVRVVAPFVAPAHAYGPGHRGIDLAARLGADVASPAPGVVGFAGTVVDRGIVTIDHGAGLVTTLEPVDARVAVGTLVVAGETVGTVAVGGHAAPGTLHFGVREHGAYINPLLLFGAVPRAVLLPCC